MNQNLIKLLNTNYHKYQAQYEVDDYIRQLREAVKTLKLQNDYLSKKESYIPLTVPRNYIFNNEFMDETELENPTDNFIAITITFDQKKFPQLIITPLSEQINYIKKVLSIFIYDESFTSIYGSFERQKNGYIHAHLIMPYYGNILNLHDKLSPYFTNRSKSNKQYAVLIKPVDNLQKWFEYINKTETFKEFIEYNLIKKNPLDL